MGTSVLEAAGGGGKEAFGARCLRRIWDRLIFSWGVCAVCNAVSRECHVRSNHVHRM